MRLDGEPRACAGCSVIGSSRACPSLSRKWHRRGGRPGPGTGATPNPGIWSLCDFGQVINILWALSFPFVKWGVATLSGCCEICGFMHVKPQPSVILGCCARVDLPFCLPQEAEIDSIHQLVVGATENIKEGNEDIREVGAPRALRPALAPAPESLAGAEPTGLTSPPCCTVPVHPCQAQGPAAHHPPKERPGVWGCSWQGSDQLPKSRGGCPWRSPGHCVWGTS